MAECNALTLTSFVQRGTSRLLSVPDVDKTSHLQHTTPIVNVGMGLYAIARTVRTAVSKVEEKIGQGRFIQLSLQQILKLAKSAMLINHLQNFMQTVVLQMAQRNTAADAKVVCSQKLGKINQKITHQKRKNDLQAPKISFLAFLTTLQNASKILVLTLILSIFFNFIRNSKDAVLCLELK